MALAVTAAANGRAAVGLNFFPVPLDMPGHMC